MLGGDTREYPRKGLSGINELLAHDLSGRSPQGFGKRFGVKNRRPLSTRSIAGNNVEIVRVGTDRHAGRFQVVSLLTAWQLDLSDGNAVPVERHYTALPCPYIATYRLPSASTRMNPGRGR